MREYFLIFVNLIRFIPKTYGRQGELLETDFNLFTDYKEISR